MNTTSKIAVESEEKERPGQEEMRPLTALEALMYTPKMVLLGNPGSGKSTYVNHLAFCLASDQLDPRAGWLDRLEGWPEAWAGLLPVPVTLRDLALWLETERPRQRKADLLAEYLHYWLEQRQQGDFAEDLLDLLRDGKALLLIDGLDEVPPADAVVGRVQMMLDDLPKTFPGPILVTCRVLSYEDERWQLDDAWPTRELDELEGEQIDWFIAAWYEHLAEWGVKGQAKRRIADLQQAVRRRDLWRMARNPLLLTVMALLHSRNQELPEKAAQVYKDAAELLLWRWESTKPEKGTVADWRDLLKEANVDNGDVMDVMRKLAFDAHSQMATGEDAGKDKKDANEITADIPEERLRTALCGLIDEEWGRDWAEELLKIIRDRAGLLVEIRPGVYRFPHRTFQEYLAGSYLSVQGDFVDQAVALASEGAYWWDVILLGVGHLKHVNRDVDKSLALINELCPTAPPAMDNEIGWRNVWLAGRCLREMGHIPPNKDLGKTMKRRLPERLEMLITHDLLEPRERAETGSVLSALGDPRGFGEMLPVPAGRFTMGSQEDDRDAYSDEKPQHTIHVDAFRIGKYPITNNQYVRFVVATDHRPPTYWRGQEPPPELRNHPVVNVRWHDARAYCQWLSQEKGEEYRLPTEAEWEKAARGDKDARAYPWDDGFDFRKCNMADTGIGGTSPVGMFAAGSSPCGCLDMSGNVWEWTLSSWGKDFSEPEHKYPYDSTDGRENVHDDDMTLRVVRGGSFLNLRPGVRCASRDGDLPHGRHNSSGFRVVAPGLGSLLYSDL